MRTWIVVTSLIAAAVFIGLGFIFLGLDLGTADQVASVASFFVGLTALIVPIVFRNSEQRTSAKKPRDEPKAMPHVQINDSSHIQVGNGSTMNVKNDHRTRRWFQR